MHADHGAVVLPQMGVLVKRERQYPTPRSNRSTNPTPRSVQYPTELSAVVGKCGNTITSRCALAAVGKLAILQQCMQVGRPIRDVG